MSLRRIEDHQGHIHQLACIGCAMSAWGDDAPGCLIVTEHFHAHQDFEVPIPGFVILSTRRHVHAIDALTDQELAEFSLLLARLRRAQRVALKIEHIYLIQEEDTQDHFHIWLLPRYEWMTDEVRFGRKVASARPVQDYARSHMKTKENIAAVQEAIRLLKAELGKD